MKKNSYILLGAFLTLVTLGVIACGTTKTGYIAPTDMASPIGGGPPKPIEEMNQGDFDPDSVIQEGEIIDEQRLLSQFDFDRNGVVENQEAVAYDAFTKGEKGETPLRKVEYKGLDQTVEAVAEIAPAVGTLFGPQGAILGSLLSTGILGVSRFLKGREARKLRSDLTQQEQVALDFKEGLKVTIQGIDQYRNSARLMEDTELGKKVDYGLVTILEKAHKAAGVMEVVTPILREVETPYAVPVDQLDTNEDG